MSGRSSIIGVALMLLSAVTLTLLVPLVTERAAMRLQPGLAKTEFDTVRGEQIFKTRCAVCHASAEGDLSRLGPSLRSIGADAASRRPGLNGPEYILESILKPSDFMAPTATAALMPQNLVADLSDEDVRHLVAYLVSLGGSPRDAEIQALVIEYGVEAETAVLEVQRETIDLGERVFRERCHDCHGMHNLTEYTVHAPIVFGVGVPEGDALREAILHRRAPFSERYQTSRIELVSGRALEGNIVQRSAGGLVLVSTRPEERGRILRVALSDIRTDAGGRPAIVSLGPPPALAAVVDSLTPAEIDALVVLLRALN